MSREKKNDELVQMYRDLAEIFDEEYEKRRLITPQNTAEKMTDKGYRKQSEWISVKERLPERSTRVLAYSKKYNEADVYYYGGAEEWWDNDGWASAKYYEITHWMPLPEPPKKKGGAE